MKLIVGLGNPGAEYVGTRHNLGWAAVDFLADKLGGKWQNRSKFSAITAETTINGEKILLAKPQTFYNESGQSVRKITDFYKLDPEKDLLVVCDDLNLPFGTLRRRKKGSDGGNNGLKSISAAIGENFARLRIGTDNDLRATIGDTDFVLGKFSKEESKRTPETLTKVDKIIAEFIEN
jgi:PTH1 family peptidyl-tRNA hydrolase